MLALAFGQALTQVVIKTLVLQEFVVIVGLLFALVLRPINHLNLLLIGFFGVGSGLNYSTGIIPENSRILILKALQWLENLTIVVLFWLFFGTFRLLLLNLVVGFYFFLLG